MMTDFDPVRSKLPQQQFVVENGCLRHFPQRFVEWELNFMRKCFQITQHPSPQQRDIWALSMAEKKLETLLLDPQNKENTAQMLDNYKRRIYNWFKNMKAKLKRGESIADGVVDADNGVTELETESPVKVPRPTAQNRYFTVVQSIREVVMNAPHEPSKPITRPTKTKTPASNKPSRTNRSKLPAPSLSKPKITGEDSTRSRHSKKRKHEHEPNQKVHEGQEHQESSRLETLSELAVIHESGASNGSKLDILAELASRQMPFEFANPRVSAESYGDDHLQSRQEHFDISAYRDERFAKYDADVLFGATLLMRLKLGKED